MAFNDEQNESALPIDGNSKRKSQDHLPRYYRTTLNKKFLGSTLDQLIQPGVAEKINSYYGRKSAKAFQPTDNYIGDVSSRRDNYQLEPASVIKDELDNVIFYKDYNDYINQLDSFNKGEKDESVVNSQEYYAWHPHIDWDKFTNFREYYWLPSGPQAVTVRGNTIEVESSIKVTSADNDDNNTYQFSTYGTEHNPTITLYRGQTYRFEVDTPGLPFTIKTKRSLDDEFSLDSSTILVESGVDLQGLEKGVTTVKFDDDIPDIIYYVAENDLNAAGTIILKDLTDATYIDVEKEVLGKRFYKTASGFNLSNGMKIEFRGEVEPEKYTKGAWYVEGVGDSIRLISESELNVPTAFTDDITIEFDSEGFDRLPYSKAIGYPAEKDYLVINRSSKDGNLWSRYNRWFHRSVIETSAEINNQPIDVDQNARAKRPIIEFDSGLKLHKFGTKAKLDVDLVDNYTTDVFSTIEGKQGYNIDGINVADGMRILFTADTDVLVQGRIFEVEYINFASGAATNRQIHLKEVDDTQPLENEVVLVLEGNDFKGKLFYYDGTEWQLTQDKTDINQAPLFDIFDDSGNSYGDVVSYPASNFAGTKLFSYKTGSGTNDTELGFPISYRSIENVGDILFDFNLLSDTSTYTLDNQVYTKETKVGYLRRYFDIDTYNSETGWLKAETDSSQPVIRQYVFDNSFNEFAIDVYDNSGSIDDLWIRVYLNNELKFEDTDYTIGTNVEGNAFVKFNNTLTLDDNIIIKTKSKAIKNSNGYYEIPINLERNPLNEDLVDFTLGEVNDHVSTIVEGTSEFSGKYPGVSNLRDLGGLSQYGSRFVQHSAPLNFSLYHLLDKDANAVKAIRFAKVEYAKFKRSFLQTAENTAFGGTVRQQVDSIFKEMNKDKADSMPFYFSDMIPLGSVRKNEYIIEDVDQTFFALATTFLLTEQTRRAVLVYKNNEQLIYQKDYTFNEDGFCVLTVEKELDDVINIYEYENTNASYVPPTPTKLGLYPKYEPGILIDDSYTPYVDEYTPSSNVKTQFAISKIHSIVPNELVKVSIEGAEQFDNYTITTRDDEKIVQFDNPIEAGDRVTIEYPRVVIQGHDGSIVHAYNDFRDDLLLEVELRIFNNLKVDYDPLLFDVHSFVGGEHRNTGLTRHELNKPMLKDFLAFSSYAQSDYTQHNFFERTNRFTFNLRDSSAPTYSGIPGFWRQIYKEAFDTDRPHTHPWEMLGFTIKPKWWEEKYGPAPYTKDNLLLWQDIEGGLVKEPGKKFIIREQYKRPGLTSHIPVDEYGYLQSPIDSGYIRNYTNQSINDSFVFGDGAPVESAWRKSSEYPFALLVSMMINKPSKTFATGFDRIRQTRNLAGQLIYGDTDLHIQLRNLVFPNTATDTTQVYTAGIVNYIANYLTTNVMDAYDNYKSSIQKIQNQIGFKIGGFTDKDKFKLILDSRTPTNEGNVFVPDENYKIFLNTSSPIETISYSGVIIEKRADGFVVKGYDNENAFFKYHRAVSSQKDPSINIGGVSESYLTWSSNKTYVTGSNVEYQGSYYRVKENHVSGPSFDSDKFSKLPYLPLVGGRDAFIRKQFVDTFEEELAYGTLLETTQEVVDFLLGYGNWLESKGFSFDYFEGDQSLVIDWRHSVNEFLFWTTQNWSAGSVITLSPAATRLSFRSEYSTVDNIFDTFYGYSLLKSDGKKLVEEFSSLGRDANEFIIKPKNTADGIFAVKLPLVQTEHVCLIDNRTVFGDVIYDLQPGYRQERIKVLGYRTDEWDGSFNIPGFVYDNVKITTWEPWQDYAIGDVVKYKEFYYSADTKIPGEATFSSNNWVRLEEKPEGGLFANFEYKTNQFGDFYDLDSDNFDIEQQKLAQHLIGYQKRTYLENIINDSVSQYKFYQGMIQDKGTQNALTKLFDALGSADKDSLEFYEEWAIKDNQYGAADGFDEVEYKLDESKFRLTPQPIELVNSVTGKETDLIYRILPYETYVKSTNYDHSPFPAKNVLDTYVKNAGYVNQDDVVGIVATYADITQFFYDQIDRGAYIWAGTHNRSWSVFRHIDTDYNIKHIISGDGEFSIETQSNVHGISAGDVIGIGNLYKYTPATADDSTQTLSYENIALEGFFEVTEVKNNKITVTSDETVDDYENINGTLSTFIEVRTDTVKNANIVLQKGVDENDLIWIDNDNNGYWSVLKNTQAYNELQTLSNESSYYELGFAEAMSVDERNTTLLVGVPDDVDGKVYVYNRPSNSVNFVRTQIIEPFTDFAKTYLRWRPLNNLRYEIGTVYQYQNKYYECIETYTTPPAPEVVTFEPSKFTEVERPTDLQRFGASVAITPDAEYAIIGSPGASNLKTKYAGAFSTTSNYTKGSIVLKDQSLWQALITIDGALDNIEFDSFASTSQIAEDLGITSDTTLQGPSLLIGNYAIDEITGYYAFPDTPTGHILVRVPGTMYDGSGVDDEIRLKWNKLTYSNQDQTVPVSTEPFGGDYSLIDGEYITDRNLTIKHKVDVILYINAATNVPQVGDLLETTNASGTVVYVFADASETVIYLKDTNGTFNTTDSLFKDNGDFVGEYVKQGPIDSINTEDTWGGYWFIDTSAYTPTTLTQASDEGKALIIYDVIPDSTYTGRYYYNSLDYKANTTNSQNTLNNYIRVLSFLGAPGPGGVSGEYLSNYFVVRAPKQLTDSLIDGGSNVSVGDDIDLYINQIPTIDGDVVKDITDINLNTTITNKTHTIQDIWDGYIFFEFTKFFEGTPFEPKVGITVYDNTTGAEAEVAFYQRSGNSVTIFVKNVTGRFSRGDDFGENAEIGFRGDGDPADEIYEIDRLMGQIQYVGLGYEPAGIGQLLVFDAGTNIAIPDSTDTLLGAEAWFYNTGQVSGIARAANPPSPINNEWKQVYKIPANVAGDPADGFVNEGCYSLYKKARSGLYDLVETYTVPERADGMFLGSDIKITKFNNLYRAFVRAAQSGTEDRPGRIYLIKDGTENDNTYDWEYAKNKKFKGAFSEGLNYYTGDIVYLEDITGTLYTAKTNIAAGVFDSTDWTSTDDVIDYVGYIPNNTGLRVFNDSTDGSTVLDQGSLYNFGETYDVAKNGDVLIASALYKNDKPNRVVVYRTNSGHFERRQELLAPNNTIGFGRSISISDDGMTIAVGAPYDDDLKLDQGIVYLYKQVDGEFVLNQTLNSINNERNEMFGWNVEFDGNTLAVSSRNADSVKYLEIDNGEITFDNDFTRFTEGSVENNGVIYLYENYNDDYIFAQTISQADPDVNYFGRNVLVKNNHVYVGLPRLQKTTQGHVFDYRKNDNSKIWEIHRVEKQTVDIDRIKKVFLYDTVEKEVVTYLDYIDPLQGKVAGIAEQELSFKTYYDPATYTTVNASPGTAVIQDGTGGWGAENVGKVWWDLSTAKFRNPYQGSVIYSTQNWNKVFLGNTIDVYEWVESSVLPSLWDEQADTNTGFSKGYSGTSLYGDDVYSTRFVYDSVSQSFKTKYYFWVKNKKITPDIESRNINIFDIARYIEDPQLAGIKYISLISPTQFVLFNCEDLIKGTDIALNVQWWNIENQTQNIHNQYQIISDGLETSQPKRDVLKKWFDSLIGYDDQNRKVPDPALSPKYKYGTLNKPRQSWFVNRIEALKQFIERVNSVLKQNLIIDDKSITALLSNEEPPVEESRLYDASVDTISDLQFIGVAKAEQASLTPVIENGKITRVIINNSGRGYRVAPTVTVYGNGEGAELELEIDNVGQITNVIVKDSGFNYDSDTVITVRRFTVFVQNDETIQGKWALYERINEGLGRWNRIKSQAYDVSLYWDYVDWYADGYSDLTSIDFSVDNSYELTSLSADINDIVKINNVGTGGWLLLRKIDEQQNVDYTVNYETVGRQDGTIAFKETLYNTISSNVGFDTISFDSKIYDNEPVQELKIVLNAIKDDLLIDELLYEFNQLFFASLRYVFTEQQYVDWAFKTSFIKAKHNVGELRKDITFNNDNLPSYEDYVREVKPYKTKIREYLSAYEGVDNTQSLLTDFDLAPRYDFNQGKIIPQSVKVVDNVLIGTDTNFETYPNKHWLDNVSYKVLSVVVTNPGEGYLSVPKLKLSGGGGTGAELYAYLGKDGSITNVEVINQGSGYLSQPTVTIDGNLKDGGTPAQLSVVIGDSPVRSMHTTVKFDRITGTYVHTVLSQTETFNGVGNKFEFDLKWPMDLNTNNVNVIVNGIEALDSEYDYENVLDTSKGYDRYIGRITFIDAPLVGETVIVSYKKAVQLLEAQDRIEHYYEPTDGQIGKDLGQLMDGIDYGGVEVKSFTFGGLGGFDDNVWGDGVWDATYDVTFEDEIFEFDGSTVEVTLSKPLEDGVVYNVYLNNVRIDDPNYDGSSAVDNPNAIMRSLTGDGVTQTLYLDDLKTEEYDEEGWNTGPNLKVKGGDKLVIRKTTSDGTFDIDPEGYDTVLSGGNLTYSTATGLNAEDITIDGDGFVTPTTSKGPEELVPGQLLDTVDIKIYEKPKGGTSLITSRVYKGDGVTTTYDIGANLILESSLFVKVGFDLLASSEYEIDYTNNTVTLNVAPALDKKVHISSMGVSGTNIIDIDEFTADGSTAEFLTSVRWSNKLDYFVTIDGVKQTNVIYESDDTYEVPNNVVLKFPTSPDSGARIRYAFFEKDTLEDPLSYSEVVVDTFTADGSTTSFTLSQTPFTEKPASWYTIVKVNDKILNAGYNKQFVCTSTKLEYKLDEWQYPAGSIRSGQIKVFLNDTELEYLQDWQFIGTPSTSDSDGTLIRLKASVQQQDGDILDVYLMTDGEYSFGTISADYFYTETPGILQLNSPYEEDDTITVYQFSNHDHQGIERLKFDVTDRLDITDNAVDDTDANLKADWYKIMHLRNGLVELRKEAIDAQYVWVSLNGNLLTPSVDYYVTDNKRYVKITASINEDDVVEIIQFSNPITKDKFGWRQFKDMLNRTHYKRLDGTENIRLVSDLHWYDNEIVLENYESLPDPGIDPKNPAVVFIEGERIEYYIKDKNKLKQLRRGTLGTGVKEVYNAGIEIYNQSASATMPYKDETITTVFIADGTSAQYELDFVPGSVNEFEVFVAGRRLRKNAISIYTMPDPIAQDSPEGDETADAEFSVEDNLLTLAEIPGENQRITVIRKQGRLWSELGTPLGDADTDIARFLRAKSVDLPR